VTRLAAFASGLALSLLLAAPAQALRTNFFGISHGPALDHQDLQTMSEAGVQTDRFLLFWQSVEPTKGTFKWGATDALVGGLAAHGIQPLPFIVGSPPWTASGGPRRPPLKSAAAERAWQDFLRAAVNRYRPGGTYWANRYHQQFGAGAAPLPITAWQIWNEPNLRPEFDPGGTVGHAAHQYAELLKISHDAIKSQDPQARIVLAGIATQNDPHAFDFLNALYSVPKIKSQFDVVAQHPYAADVNEVGSAIQRLRAVMRQHDDQATPLWITEVGWGSAPPDGTGINLGPNGQARILRQVYGLVLSHRNAWNIQRIYWFHWRDPAPGSSYANVCLRCASAGLLQYDRTPKPAYNSFTALATDTTPPQVRITAGPAKGSSTSDSTPTFAFHSSEVGSTYQCRFDSRAFSACTSPFTASPALGSGPHTFRVRAIDAPGNVSATVSRSFTVDAG
jgi:Glycosyl hydrolase catalytic core